MVGKKTIKRTKINKPIDMDIREDIRRRTELPRIESPAEFRRIKKSKSRNSLDPKNFRITSPKNGHIFESLTSDDYGPNNDEMASEGEIRAAIQEMTGGPAITNEDIVDAWRRRQDGPKIEGEVLKSLKSGKYRNNVLMRSILNKKMEGLSVQEGGPSESSHGQKTVTKNIRKGYALVQHPDDSDFFCLKDTTTDNSDKEKDDDFFFSFRGKETVKTPRDYLLDTVTDDMFVFEKP